MRNILLKINDYCSHPTSYIYIQPTTLHYFKRNAKVTYLNHYMLNYKINNRKLSGCIDPSYKEEYKNWIKENQRKEISRHKIY